MYNGALESFLNENLLPRFASVTTERLDFQKSMKTMSDKVNKGPSLYYVSKRTGWVGSGKWQFFADIQYYLCRRRVSGWVKKVQKKC